LQNLLENAENHAEVNGDVSISTCERSAGQVEITVRDHGQGVAEEELERIFARFHRAKSDRAPSAGTGIGLSICRAIVEAHGGEIRAQLPAGGGLAVSFTVPLAYPTETSTK